MESVVLTVVDARVTNSYQSKNAKMLTIKEGNGSTIFNNFLLKVFL
jgi:hypothetical protein